MLTWQGHIGRFASLIAASDEYIGYDSAGQHIAAALGVPVIDIFTPPVSPVFQERWTPSGRGMVYAVAPAGPGGEPRRMEAVLAEVLALHKKIR